MRSINARQARKASPRCSEAATLGAGTVLVEGVAAGPPELAELLAASGFSAVGDLHLRRLRGPTG